jgi:hypothetical protein
MCGICEQLQNLNISRSFARPGRANERGFFLCRLRLPAPGKYFPDCSCFGCQFQV